MTADKRSKRDPSNSRQSRITRNNLLAYMAIGSILLIGNVFYSSNEVDSFSEAYRALRGVRGNQVIVRDAEQPSSQSSSTETYLEFHRALSISLSNGGCRITWPKPPISDNPSEIIEPTYAATFPGSNSRLLWALLESMTGLWSGDDANSKKRGRNVVSIKTSYPHRAGRLVGAWDHEGNGGLMEQHGGSAGNEQQGGDHSITRGFVLLRHPGRAIFDLWQSIYTTQLAQQQQQQTEQSDPLPPPAEAWMEWRNKSLSGQLNAYIDFLRYWTHRYGTPTQATHGEHVGYESNDHLEIFSYEALTSPQTGVEETLRLAEFMNKARGVTVVDRKSLPCIWNKIFGSGWDETSEMSEINEANQEGQTQDQGTQGRLAVQHRRTSAEQEEAAFLRQVHESSRQLNHLGDLNGLQGTQELKMQEQQQLNGEQQETKETQLQNLYTLDQLELIANTLQELTGEFKHNGVLHAILLEYYLEVMHAQLVVTDGKQQLEEANQVGQQPQRGVGQQQVGSQELQEIQQVENQLLEIESQVRSQDIPQDDGQVHAEQIQPVESVEHSPAEVPGTSVSTIQLTNQKGEPTVIIDPNLPRRLFYCGSTGPKKGRRHSIFGIFLANSFFPEVIGRSPGDRSGERAIHLDEETAKEATENDVLVYHMHQWCEVDIMEFPGLQLHVNVEYYDMHPEKFQNLRVEGRYTLNYLPPSPKVFTLGPHQDTYRSIRLPYAMMKWWVLAKGSNPDLNMDIIKKFFVPESKPKNTQQYFLLYPNSHYVEFRERAAHDLAEINTIHVLGKCQGNVEMGPLVEGSATPQCQPFPEYGRPQNVQMPPDTLSRGERGRNHLLFHKYRFVLLMENTNVDGYVSEKILDGFLSGAVPIYYGTKQVMDIFNPKAFIYYDIENPREALERIAYLESHPEEYQKVLDEPILAEGERTIEKYFSFEDAIGGGLLKRRVREMMGFDV